MAGATSATEAFADAVSALVDEPDVADVLAHLVSDCAAAMGAEAVAILARDETGGLSMLTASSHRASELELLQIQRSTGPCIDVIELNEALFATGAEEIIERWQQVGETIVNAGFESVEAYPLRWRGTALGGLNVFRSSAPIGGADPTIGQAFADIATLAVIYSAPIATEDALARLHEALGARDLVEQAKGVIAHLENVDMSTAYNRLLERADTTGETLTRTAAAVLDERRRAR